MDPQVILLAAARLLVEGDHEGFAKLAKDPAAYAPEPDTTDQADDTPPKD